MADARLDLACKGMMIVSPGETTTVTVKSYAGETVTVYLTRNELQLLLSALKG